MSEPKITSGATRLPVSGDLGAASVTPSTSTAIFPEDEGKANPRLDQGQAVPLDIRDLSVAYGARVVLEQVNLQVQRGELLGLIGPNGAGKTTLIRAALGLVPTLSGQIRVAGFTGKAAARKIGYVPQRHEFAWDYPISVEKVVLSGISGKLNPFQRIKRSHWQRVYAALDQVQMFDYHSRVIGKLSGGQRQRVLIARALASQPEILILDEPFTGLDQPTIDLLLQLFKQLVRRGGTILMSTHDIAGALDSCDRLAMVNHTLRALGRPTELLQPKLWMDTYQVSRSSPLLRSIGLPPVAPDDSPVTASGATVKTSAAETSAPADRSGTAAPSDAQTPGVVEAAQYQEAISAKQPTVGGTK